MNLTYRISKTISNYMPIIKECGDELGSRFQNSLENWCGIGHRPYPLKTWKVYLVFLGTETVGLCSYYQEFKEPDDVYWIGWIATRPQYRRKRIGARMINFILSEITGRGGRIAFVHTGGGNMEAITFYHSIGFCDAGLFADKDIQQASAEDGSVVLKINLCPPPRFENGGTSRYLDPDKTV